MGEAWKHLCDACKSISAVRGNLNAVRQAEWGRAGTISSPEALRLAEIDGKLMSAQEQILDAWGELAWVGEPEKLEGLGLVPPWPKFRISPETEKMLRDDCVLPDGFVLDLMEKDAKRLKGGNGGD